LKEEAQNSQKTNQEITHHNADYGSAKNIVSSDLWVKDFNCPPALKLTLKSDLLNVAGKFFACPECGKQDLTIHRKTYEQTIIVYCDSCHFTSSYEPSKEAYYDTNKAWEEVTANYKMVHSRSRKQSQRKGQDRFEELVNP
jgi:predicted RNA-binding Zn-ribbon protein involved in translation (DUF1610 family)